MVSKKWMIPSDSIPASCIVLYRAKFTLPESTQWKLRFSSDERADIFLNGEWLADGPERGDNRHRFYRDIQKDLKPGEYTLVARCLQFGLLSAHSQVTVQPGFTAEMQQRVQWEWQVLENISFSPPFPDWGVYPVCDIHEKFDWNYYLGASGLWRPVKSVQPLLTPEPPFLPEMRRETETNYRIFRTPGRIRILFDDYVCVRAEYRWWGSGSVRVRWGEALYRPGTFDLVYLVGEKGVRDDLAGKEMIGNGCSFQLPGGECRWHDYWWRAGRCVEFETNGNVELQEVKFERTGYPLTIRSGWNSAPPPLRRILDMAWKTLERCSSEIFMDCPYFEQLQYVADVRLDALSLLASGGDDRLIRKALIFFADSVQPDGMIMARWPSRKTQVIPSYGLYFVFLIEEFARWRDVAFALKYLPVCRGILAWMKKHLVNGLLSFPGWHCIASDEPWTTNSIGWNFLDWNDRWPDGVPPGDAALNFLYGIALEKCAELETLDGSADQAAECLAEAETLSKKMRTVFWSSGTWYDDAGHQYCSEHTAALSVLFKAVGEKSMVILPDMVPTSISFSWFFLEAARQTGQRELFNQCLSRWYGLEKHGLRTLPENFENPRSDCHAWSSHIIYHYYASILGRRPDCHCGKPHSHTPDDNSTGADKL